jgi:hypothetical protein
VRQSKELAIADISDVLSWGWDGPRLVDEVIELWYETIEGLTYENVGEPEQWLPVFMEYPDTWRLFVSAPETIVGYWHFLPLSAPLFALAKQGRLLDRQITASGALLPMDKPGWYDIYAFTVCVRSGFRGVPVLMLMGKSFLDVVRKFAEKGIFIRQICSNVFTPIGLGFNQALGLSYVCDHIDHGKIFLGDFPSVLEHNRFRDDPEFKVAELCELYEASSKG